MNLADAAGWLGAAALLLAYAASASGRMLPTDRRYQWINLLASVGLAVVAGRHHAWPSLALNAVWIGISAVALAGRRVPARADAPDAPAGSTRQGGRLDPRPSRADTRPPAPVDRRRQTPRTRLPRPAVPGRPAAVVPVGCPHGPAHHLNS